MAERCIKESSTASQNRTDWLKFMGDIFIQTFSIKSDYYAKTTIACTSRKIITLDSSSAVFTK